VLIVTTTKRGRQWTLKLYTLPVARLNELNQNAKTQRAKGTHSPTSSKSLFHVPSYVLQRVIQNSSFITVVQISCTGTSKNRHTTLFGASATIWEFILEFTTQDPDLAYSLLPLHWPLPWVALSTLTTTASANFFLWRILIRHLKQHQAIALSIVHTRHP
jgi:hypothetical protein